MSKLYSLLRQLHISRGDVIFLHTSFKRLRYQGLTSLQFIELLIDYLGPDGTLAMPRYAWNLDKSARPWKGYRQYFEDRPEFDVGRTPANIGVVPETFRFVPGVKQSLSYFWSISCWGKLAQDITTGQEDVVHPFGEGSSFDLLRDRNTKIVGLGVSLNTTSLAPLIDFALGEKHPHQVFTLQPQRGIVVDWDGNKRETHTFWILPEVVRLIKPSKVLEISDRAMKFVRRADEESTVQFSYPFEIFYQEAVRLGFQALNNENRVPWLADYPCRNR